VDVIYNCKGKVVITGMGKSGLIGQKIASTFSSTGTPAFFLHPAEGIHGDLGILSRNDIVIAISNSGETEEVAKIIPIIKRLGIKLIAITGSTKSTLAKVADIIIDVGVKEEACPLNLVPTASTTAALALGDALAVSLLDKRGFREEDFALIHPGGMLGRKLILRVEDVMHAGDKMPIVKSDTGMKEILIEMTSKRFGITGVVNNKGELIGVITDGDLRRSLEMHPDIMKKKASEIMTSGPKKIEKSALAVKALKFMEDYAITCLFVYDNGKEHVPVGVLHLHDLLRVGAV